MLRTFNKLPRVNTVTILIVGAPGIGKHQLAKLLVSTSAEISVEVHTTTRLPLPEDKYNTRPRIDFVIFMVDQTNRESFLVVKRSLSYLDFNYTMGKMCFVLTAVNNTISRSVSLDAMMQLAETYCSQVLCCDLQNSEEKHCLANQLLCKLNLSSGLQNGVTSLLVDTTRVMTSQLDTMES